MVYLLKHLQFMWASLVFTAFSMIPIILIALMGVRYYSQQPSSSRLHDLKNDEKELKKITLKEDLRAVPKLIKMQGKSLLIIASVIFLLIYLSIVDIDNGAKIIGKIFTPTKY